MESRVGELTGCVEEARRRGARGSEALLERAQGVRMHVQRGRVAAEEPVDEASLTVRVWLEGGREGSATGSPEDASALIDRALAAASEAEEDPFAGPAPRLQAILGGLGVDDRRYGAVTRADRVEVVATAERSVRQTDRRLAPADFRYEDRRRQRVFANSKGVALEEYDTAYVASGAASGSYDGDAIRLEGSISARTFASIASLPYGTAVARRAAGLMQRGERLEGEVLVMLPPLAIARLFGRLAECFTHDTFAEGSFFLAPRDDGPQLDPRIHLLDDGALPGGFRTRSFDDRGTAPVALTLLREGRPDGRFLDLRTARSLDVRPTGHLTRAGLAPSNLMLRTGTRSMNAILTDRDTWTFLVDDLPDLSGLDLATGRLDALVSGQVMHSNVVKGAMRNVRLRGNLLEVFGKLEDLASDTDRFGHVDAPGMLVRGFSLG